MTTGDTTGGTSSSTTGTNTTGTSSGTTGTDGTTTTGGGSSITLDDTYADGEKISGTLARHLKVTATVPSGFAQGYLHYQIDNIAFQFTDSANQVVTATATPTGTENHSFSQRIRFATTKFANGNLTITVTANYSRWNDGAHEPGSDSVDVKPVVYNVGLRLATQEKWDDATGTYVVDNSGDPLMCHAVSLEAAKYAASALASMKHSDITGGAVDNQTETALAPLLKQASAILFFTHGTDYSIRSSIGDDIYFRALAQHTNEMLDYVQTNRTQPQLKAYQEGNDSTWNEVLAPGPNLVVTHGCMTELNHWSALSDNQEYTPSSGSTSYYMYKDRCYAGFQEVIWTYNPQPGHNNEHVSEHAKAVYDGLVAGMTIQDAVAAANDKHPAAGDNGLGTVKMQLHGDPNARLINVYTGAPTNQNDTWYKFEAN